MLLPSIEMVPGSFLLNSLIANLTSRCCWVSKIVNATPINRTRTITGIKESEQAFYASCFSLDELVLGFHSAVRDKAGAKITADC